VLETCAPPGFGLWPVAGQPQYHLTPLTGALNPDEVGTVMAVLAEYNSSAADPGPADSPATAFLSSLLGAEGFIAPGGLRIQDSEHGTTLTPGCCCGLEDWRGWLEVADGDELWLGHDPTPWTEHIGARVRLHPDSERPGPVIEIARAELPRLLASVQQDLADFLLLIAAWADQYAPGSAEALADAVDRSLRITTPLRSAGRRR
jgi:hypothetical protein